MAEYTWNPAPVFEARQINNQEDGDAWVASLTDLELRNDHDGIVFTDVRIEVESERFWLKWTRTDTTDGSQPQQFFVPLGGYAVADKTGQVLLFVEDEANFNRRFQPYVEC